jgi:outer membrane autotransporter protein
MLNERVLKVIAITAVGGFYILGMASTGIADPGVDLTSLARTPAQKAVASVLQSESSLSSISDAVLSLPAVEQQQALERLSPRKVFTMVQNSIRGSKNKRFNIKRRMSKIRLGQSNKLDVSGFAFNYKGTDINGDILKELLPEKLIGGAAGDSDLVPRQGFFISGTVSQGDYDRVDDTDPYEFDSWNLAVGTDYRLTEALTAGVLLSFETSDTDFTDMSKIDMSEVGLSFYGLYTFQPNMYLEGTAGYGWNSYETTRSTGLAGFGSAVSDPKGRQWHFSLEMGRDFEYERWRFEPSISTTYTKVDIDAYTEVGAGAASLVVSDQDARSFIGRLGGRIGYEYDNPNSFFVPEIHAYWEHEFENDSRSIDSAFAGAPGTVFAVPTEKPDRDYVRVGLGLTGHLGDSTIVSVSGDSVIGYDNLEEYTLAGSVKWKF